MGEPVNAYLARLIILTSAGYQLAAAIFGFLYPKILFDFATKQLDCLITPIPFLQILNVALSLVVLCWEWPLYYVAELSLQRKILPRLIIYPVVSAAAIGLYQATNAALYYLIGTLVYLLAYISEREG
ncbi:hypothetical protein N657DRAFT_581829 [Parathielavia appendiculata]|uniref:DUF7727 domain-containing protein n=1 Tax=Parathielavia appendiculata TaxID=2587402 RepID=A0AAN6TRI1_9PEZI|nr:hypothetical protein N657DRAFT_581829 [Parathielavia appendiculata]